MLEALQSSALAAAIGQSQVWLASLSALHLVGFTLVLGSAVVTNLRFLGALFPERPSTDVTAASTRMLLVGLALSAASGALMFVPRAAGAAANPMFRLKLGLVLAAVVLQAVVQPRAASTLPGTTGLMRALGLSGAVLWLGAALAACAFILLE